MRTSNKVSLPSAVQNNLKKTKSFLYEDESDDWRWKTVIGQKFESKRIVGASTEGYERRNDAIENYMLMVGLDRIPLWDHRGAQKRITKATGLGY